MELKLSNSKKTAIIDEVDIPLVYGLVWMLIKGYPATKIYSPLTQKTSTLYLHIFLLGTRQGFEIDHIDRNPLNNSRENLRWATHTQNLWNSSRRSDNSSGVRGVSYGKQNKKWHAYINKNKKRIYLGHFDSKEQAVQCRRNAEIELYGEFAPIAMR